MLSSKSEQIAFRRKGIMSGEHYAFVLVADQKYWKRLCQRSEQSKQSHFFVRKNAVAPTKVKKLLFYVKKTKKPICGTADFVERLVGETEEMWSQFGAESFFESADEYRDFAEGRKKMTFIRFQNFQELADPKPKEVVAGVLGSLVLFRPRYVDQETCELLTV